MHNIKHRFSSNPSSEPRPFPPPPRPPSAPPRPQRCGQSPRPASSPCLPKCSLHSSQTSIASSRARDQTLNHCWMPHCLQTALISSSVIPLSGISHLFTSRITGRASPFERSTFSPTCDFHFTALVRVSFRVQSQTTNAAWALR